MPDMQRAVVFHGPHDVRVEEVPKPKIVEPGDAIVRIDRAAICGSDLHPYEGRIAIEDGVVLGHEFMGTVADVGAGVSNVEPGDRVVGSFLVCCGKCWYCRRGLQMKCSAAQIFGMGMAFGDLPGTQAEWVRVPNADLTLRKVPEGDGKQLTDDDVLFVGDILTTAYDAVRKANNEPGAVVAVVGAGPVGLMTIMSAYALGASKVVAIDKVGSRLEVAAELGAVGVNPSDTEPNDVVLELTDWRGADLVVDAVGHPSALQACFPLVRPGGTISIPGVYVEDEMAMPIGDLWLKNVTIVCGAANIPGRMDEVLALVAEGRLDPARIISHRMGLSEAEEAYKRFAAKQAMKIVLDPSN